MTTRNLITHGLTTLALCLGTAASGFAQTCDLWNPPPQTDKPDDSFQDTNGDGIDGMRCGPIFVTPNGNDSNIGTIDQPMKSISAAMMAAYQMTPKRDVYVSSEGTYYETLWLQPEVNVYGGYNHKTGWSRSTKRAKVYGGIIGAWATPVPTGFAGQTIHSLEIISQSSLTDGDHSIGLLADGTGIIGFYNCLIRSRDAAWGASGKDGESGYNGKAGATGHAGKADGEISGSIAAGGTGAFNGGYGGKGSYSIHLADPAWGGKGQGSGGGEGGDYGVYGDPGQRGKDGRDGASGQNGTHGGGAVKWYETGGSGTNGTHGHGGGGGGGGGGQYCMIFCIDGTGNGGGGGGGGGYLGTAATGGGPGGSSIAVLTRGEGLYLFAENTYLYAGAGGRGGFGGNGGKGGNGGAGGKGGTVATNEVGGGGNGGKGGKGGNGGHGGGGAGGHSITVLDEGGLVSNVDATWYPGAAGGAGPAYSGGNPGVAGVSAKYLKPGASDPRLPLPNKFEPIALHGRLAVRMDSQTVLTTPMLADPDKPESYSLTVPTQPQNGFAAAAGKQILYKPKEGYSGYDAIPIRYTDTAHTPEAVVNGYVVVYVAPPPLGLGDAGDALRIGAGLKARASSDARLDVNADGRITILDAVEILRGL